MWSFLASAFITTALSWYRILSVKHSRPASDADSESSYIKGLYEKTTSWHRKARWGRAVKDAISTLGLTQLITSLALLISTLVVYNAAYTDPHALLAFTLTLLATSSHVAPRAALVKTNDSKIRPLFPRCILFLGEHLAFTIHFLRPSMTAEHDPFRTVRIIVLVSGALLWVCIAANMVICLWRPKGEILPTYVQLIRLGAYASITVGTLVTVAMTTTALYILYGQRECDMLQQADNIWTFGQYLTILMLLAPVLSFVEHLIGKKSSHTHVKERADPNMQEIEMLTMMKI